jgi:hypothetical protein
MLYAERFLPFILQLLDKVASRIYAAKISRQRSRQGLQHIGPLVAVDGEKAR